MRLRACCFGARVTAGFLSKRVRLPEADSVAPAEVARNRKIATSRAVLHHHSNAIFFIHIPSKPESWLPSLFILLLLSFLRRRRLLSSFAAGGGSAFAFVLPLLSCCHPGGICFCLLPLHLFFAFSPQKPHVKPLKHITPYQPMTSIWHVSYTQTGILDIDRKIVKTKKPRGILRG